MTPAERRGEWQARVAEFRASDQSVAAWTKEHGIKAHQLYYWLKRLAPTNETERATQWLSVSVSPGSTPVSNRIHVQVGKAVVEVQPGFDTVLFTEVVRSLVALC